MLMGKQKEKTLVDLLKTTHKLNEARPSCVVEGKARMRGPGVNDDDPCDDNQSSKVCDTCRSVILAADLQKCTICDGEFHTSCLELPLNVSLSADWLCPQCHAATSKPVHWQSDRKSAQGGVSLLHKAFPKLDSKGIKGHAQARCAGDLDSEAEETSRPVTKVVVTDKDENNPRTVLELEVEGRIENEDSTVSEGDNNISKPGDVVESSEQGLDTGQYTKRGRNSKGSSAVLKKRGRNLDDVSRNIGRIIKRRLNEAADDVDELGAKIEKYRVISSIDESCEVKGVPHENNAGSHQTVQVPEQLLSAADLELSSPPLDDSKLVEILEIKSVEGPVVEASLVPYLASKEASVGPATLSLCELSAGEQSDPKVPCDNALVGASVTKGPSSESPDVTRESLTGVGLGILPSTLVACEVVNQHADQAVLLGDQHQNKESCTEDGTAPVGEIYTKLNCVSSKAPEITQQILVEEGRVSETLKKDESANKVTDIFQANFSGQYDSKEPCPDGLMSCHQVVAIVKLTDRKLEDASVDTPEISDGTGTLSEDRSRKLNCLLVDCHGVKNDKCGNDDRQILDTVVLSDPCNMKEHDIVDVQLCHPVFAPVEETVRTLDGALSTGLDSTGGILDDDKSRGFPSPPVVSESAKTEGALKNDTDVNLPVAKTAGEQMDIPDSAPQSWSTDEDKTQQMADIPSDVVSSGNIFQKTKNVSVPLPAMVESIIKSAVLVDKCTGQAFSLQDEKSVFTEAGKTTVSARRQFECHPSSETVHVNFLSARRQSECHPSSGTEHVNFLSEDASTMDKEVVQTLAKTPSCSKSPGEKGTVHDDSVIRGQASQKLAASKQSPVLLSEVEPILGNSSFGKLTLHDVLVNSIEPSQMSTQSPSLLSSAAESITCVREDDPALCTKLVSIPDKPKKLAEVLNRFEVDGETREQLSCLNSSTHNPIETGRKEAQSVAVEEDDVKVCDICGDPGYEELLAVCSACSEGAEHIYCMQATLQVLPEDGWLCEGCKLEEKAGNLKQEKIPVPQSNAGLRPVKKKVVNKTNIRSRLSTLLEKGKGSLQRRGATKGAPSHLLPTKRPADDSVVPPVSKRQASESPSLTASGANSISLRGLARDSSFKLPDSGKMRFMSANTVSDTSPGGSNLGIAIRSSGKPSSQSTSIVSLSPRILPIQQTQGNHKSRQTQSGGDASLPSSASKVGNSSVAPRLPSSSRGMGAPKVNDALPSFLLPSRAGGSKASVTLKSGKDGSGDYNGTLAPIRNTNSSALSVVVGNSKGTIGTSSNTRQLGKGCSNGVGSDQKTHPDTSRPSLQPSSAVMRGQRPKGDSGVNLIVPDTAAINPVRQTLQSTDPTKISSNTGISASPNQHSPRSSNVEFRQDVQQNAITSRQAQKLVNNPHVDGRNNGSVPLETLVARPQESQGDMSGLRGASSSLRNVEEAGKMDSTSLSGEGQRSAAVTLLPRNLSTATHGIGIGQVGSVKPNESTPLTSPPAKLVGLEKTATVGKDLKQKFCSEVSWSSGKSLPPVGTARCYKCKEIGHVAHVCPKFISSGSKSTESGPTSAQISPILTKSPRDSLGGSSSSAWKSIRPKLPENSIHHGDHRLGLLAATNGVPSVPMEDIGHSLVPEPLGDGRQRNLKYTVPQDAALLKDLDKSQRQLVVHTMPRNQGSMLIRAASQPGLSMTLCGDTTLESQTEIERRETGTPKDFCARFGNDVAQSAREVTSLARPPQLAMTGSGFMPRLLDVPALAPLMPLRGLGLGGQGQVPPRPLANDMLGREVPGFHAGVPGPGVSFVPRAFQSAFPEPTCSWRGCFEVVSASAPVLYDGMEGYSSTYAVQKVRAIISKLPRRLVLEEVNRLTCADAWPKQFQQKPPTDKEIAMYFFAAPGDSLERHYGQLLERMIVHDLVLMGKVEGAELLVFSSSLLPEQYQCWRNRKFLWGAYRSAKKSVPVPSLSVRESSGQSAATGSVHPVKSPVLSLIEMQGRSGSSVVNAGNDAEVDMEIDMVGNTELCAPEKPARKLILDQLTSFTPPLPLEPAPVQPLPPGPSAEGGLEEPDNGFIERDEARATLKTLDLPPGFASSAQKSSDGDVHEPPTGCIKTRDCASTQLTATCDGKTIANADVANVEATLNQLETVAEKGSMIPSQVKGLSSMHGSPTQMETPCEKKVQDDVVSTMSGLKQSHSQSSSLSPGHAKERDRDHSSSRAAHYSKSRRRDRDKGSRRDRQKEKDKERDRHKERDTERGFSRDRDKCKESRHKERENDKEGKHRHRWHTACRMHSRSRSFSRKRNRSPSVSLKKRHHSERYRSKRSRSMSVSDSDSHQARAPSRTARHERRRTRSKDQYDDEFGSGTRASSRSDHRKSQELSHKGKRPRLETSLERTPSLFSEKEVGCRHDNVTQDEVLKTQEYGLKAAIPFFVMSDEVGAEGEKSEKDVPFYHVFLSSESADGQAVEYERHQEHGETSFRKSVGNSSNLDLLSKPFILETSSGHGHWDTEKLDDSGALQFFPVQATNISDSKESEENPNLELALGGQDRNAGTILEPLPLFVHVDNSEPEFAESSGLSDFHLYRENLTADNSTPGGSSPLNLTLAVPQYRKKGNLWVKIEDMKGLGEEDVEFALTL